MLSKTDVIDRLTAAFAPHRCVAELQDYDSKFGFRVFGPDDAPLYTRSRVPIQIGRDARSLDQVIALAKSRMGAV